MEELKSSHPKARHFVYAYRFINEYDQIVENSSDDGEPKGTSGKPTLAVLSGKNIVNTAIITVRYFGGIRLGTGGLVRAYSDSTNLVLESAALFPYLKLEHFTLRLDYPELQKYEYLLKKEAIAVVDKTFDTQVSLTIETTKEQYEKFLLSLTS
jgi:uncharacterized YigZ family protein